LNIDYGVSDVIRARVHDVVNGNGFRGLAGLAGHGDGLINRTNPIGPLRRAFFFGTTFSTTRAEIFLNLGLVGPVHHRRDGKSVRGFVHFYTG
jgi:hypothetical protein